jgi:MFS transporter, PPP family, 3-phenylpropionic acid transporter
MGKGRWLRFRTTDPATTAGRLRWWYGTGKGGYAFSCYLAVVLADLGLGPAQTAQVFIVVPVAMLLGTVIWPAVADRTGTNLAVLRVLELLGVVALAVMLVTPTPWVFVAGLALWAFSHGGKDPVGDAFTLGSLGRQRTGYGRLRSWGELGFLVTALGMGLARDAFPRVPLGAGLGLMLVATVLTFTMPLEQREPTRRAPRSALAGYGTLLRQPLVLPALAAAVLHGAGLVTYANLFSLRVEAAGLPSWVTGAALALGSLTAMLAMLASRRLLERFGASRLFLVAVLSAAPRWLLIGVLDHPVALVLVQLLHGTTFALAWVAGVVFFAELAPRRLASSALGLFAAAIFGVASLLSMAAASALLETWTIKEVFGALSVTSVAASVLSALVVIGVARGPRPAEEPLVEGQA